jgi:hypothetical protein
VRLDPRLATHGKSAPAESVDVGTVAEFHDRDAVGLGESLKGHVVDQDLAEVGVGGEEGVYARWAWLPILLDIVP